jgi:hypothetical protein
MLKKNFDPSDKSSCNYLMRLCFSTGGRICNRGGLGMRAVVIFLLLTCVGCVSSTEYPADWPEPALTDVECPEIFGTYQDVGRLASTRGGTPAHPQSILSRYFFDYDNRMISYTRISRVNADSIRVESFEPGKDPLSRRLDSDEHFICSDGRLWISDQLRIVDDGLSLRGNERIGLTLSEDGSLVGESRVSARGRVFVIPVLARETDYVLWEILAGQTDLSE